MIINKIQDGGLVARVFYVAAKATYIRLLHGNIGFLQPPVPAYAGTEGCYEMLVFFYFFLFNA